MSADNGVIRIARKGKCKFAFGDDEPFEVDTIALHDEWYQADQSMRDEEGKVPKDQTTAYNGMKLSFVQNVVNAAYSVHGIGNTPTLTHAEAGDFVARLQEETTKLRSFFVPRLPEQPSSQESTAVRFSQ